MIKLYHCREAQSLRALWTLEAMSLLYEPALLPFPPRVHAKDFLKTNPLGTVPFLSDGDARMSESTGICLYLPSRYGPTSLALTADEPEHDRFLNWFFFSDATLTFLQTTVLRYRQLEPAERRVHQAADDYEKWFYGRLKTVEAALGDREWLCGGRFTIANIAFIYALHLAEVVVGLGDGFGPQARDYMQRARARPAFLRAAEVDAQAPPWR